MARRHKRKTRWNKRLLFGLNAVRLPNDIPRKLKIEILNDCGIQASLKDSTDRISKKARKAYDAIKPLVEKEMSMQHERNQRRNLRAKRCG